jgi:hypothetical protein
MVLRKYKTDMVVTFVASDGASDDNLLPSNERNGVVVYEEEIGNNYVEEENVVAVYCNLQSLRVSVDEFLSTFPEKKASNALEQEFKVIYS